MKNKENINKILKIVFIILSIVFITPSVIYMIKNKTVLRYKNYYNFFINSGSLKTISSIIYLSLLSLMTIIYLVLIKRKTFKNIKQVLIYTGIIGVIFLNMLPWTSSDIFYYMGVGELNSTYGQNPYYVTIEEFYKNNKENINDTILEQASINFWANTTVVYGPVAQMFFTIITKFSFKNVDLCLMLFKIVNLCVHLLNCYLIYKLTKKIKFSVIYGLNPFMFLEYIACVHNDIIIISFILLALYFLLKKKNLRLSVVFLALGTGIKYFCILLLPIAVLYHYKNEKSLMKRFVKCLQYGILFVLIMIVEYIFYFKDIKVLFAMLPQGDRYCKSIYSALIVLLRKNIKFLVSKLGFSNYLIAGLPKYIRAEVLFLFIILYIKFCLDILTTKEIKFLKVIRKYDFLLILFMLCLTNFEQWYLGWIWASMMWQRPKKIKFIINLSFISEIANSIYMFKGESWKYDAYFVGIIILFMVVQNFNNVKLFLT